MSDYDREPKSGSGKFLKLKGKGDVVIVRIASAPYREPKVWKDGEQRPMTDENAANLTEAQWARIMGNPDYNVTEVFHWKVIDRADGQAKIYSGTPGVYKKIKAYTAQESWGDPKDYDIQITRTENPGPSYYEVMALPNKTAITDKEEAAIAELEMKKLMPNARLSNLPQIDDLSEEFTGPKKPDPNETKGEIKDDGKLEVEEDIVIEDIGDEPINLDDIPF